MFASPAYKIDLCLAPATVEALVDSGYALQAMFGIEMNNKAARPTIGFATQNIAANMSIEWAAGVSAYTSYSALKTGTIIQIGYQTPVDPGQALIVTTGGIGHVKSNASSARITVANTTSSSFTSGFARAVAGAAHPSPIYAVPLYGNHINVATPLPKVLLQFTTDNLQPGTLAYAMERAVGASYGPSVLVMTSDNETRTLSYDINTGWSWGAYSWARIIPAEADLAEVLIVSG